MQQDSGRAKRGFARAAGHRAAPLTDTPGHAQTTDALYAVIPLFGLIRLFELIVRLQYTSISYSLRAHGSVRPAAAGRCRGGIFR